jgi:hypothetical protein
MSFILDSIRMTLIIQTYFFLSTTSKFSYNILQRPTLGWVFLFIITHGDLT